MPQKVKAPKDKYAFLKHITYQAGRWTASLGATLIAFMLTLTWVISGPFFQFSSRWQMVMNSVSSSITFVMVFLLQRSQTKDSLAMQIKLNEIIAALHGADNHLINIEELSESEIMSIQKNYQQLATQIQETDGTSKHAVSADDVIKEIKNELLAPA